MSFLKPWNEGVPQKVGFPAADLDVYIRDLKTALRERLAVEHEFFSEEAGHEDIVGKHKPGVAKVYVGDSEAELPSTSVGEGSVFSVPLKKVFWILKNSIWEKHAFAYVKDARLEQNGYVVFSLYGNGTSDFIIQWGVSGWIPSSVDTVMTVNFPLAFPAICFVVLVAKQNTSSGPDDGVFCSVVDFGLTSFRVRFDNTGQATGGSVRALYVAFGK